MIYKVKKEDNEFEIEDTVLFKSQPTTFCELFNQLAQDNIAEFDNCNAYLVETGRVLITYKEERDEI